MDTRLNNHSQHYPSRSVDGGLPRHHVFNLVGVDADSLATVAATRFRKRSIALVN